MEYETQATKKKRMEKCLELFEFNLQSVFVCVCDFSNVQHFIH